MSTSLLKSAAIGATAMGMMLGASFAAQADVLPVTNLTFSVYTGSSPKDKFSNVNPTGWSRGPAGTSGDLTCIGGPGQVTAAGAGGCYAIFTPLGDPPPGGNFVEADGNPDFQSIFQQTIPGLVAGDHYTLSFWQAAGQQTGFSGATTEQWRIILGGTGITLSGPTAGPCSDPTYTNCYAVNLNGGYEDTVNETIMHNASQGTVDWNLVTLDLIAPSDGGNLLQFLAWGNDGSNNNLPPTLFLAGVNTPARGAPEPMTVSLFGAGLAGVWLRRRAKRKA